MRFFSKISGILRQQALRIPKRYRFVLSVGLVAFVLLTSTFFFFTESFFFLPLLIVLTYFMTYFSIIEGVEKVEWFSLFIIPVVLTIAFYTFFFLFPARWITRLPFIIVYGVSYYAVLLCMNIFNVGVEKSLQLYRAAFSVNFFYQTLIVFLVYSGIFSFRLNFIENALVTGGVAFLLSLQLFWTVKLNPILDRGLILMAFVVAVLMAEVATVFSFIPLKPTIFALILGAIYYSIGGLLSKHLDDSLFKETVREYIVVLGFTTLIALLTISW